MDFERAAISFAQLHSILAKHYAYQCRALFNATIKTHYLLDLGIGALYMNPTLGWCYSGEDPTAKVKGIV